MCRRAKFDKNLFTAWVLFLTFVYFGFAAGEMKLDPNYHGSEQEDEADLAFILFAATEIAFAALVVKPGLLGAPSLGRAGRRSDGGRLFHLLSDGAGNTLDNPEVDLK
jgi:hypothetical protein